MAVVVRMPNGLAQAEDAAIQTWRVSPGQQVAVGDVLAEIETEKAVFEIEALFGPGESAEAAGEALQDFEAAAESRPAGPSAAIAAERIFSSPLVRRLAAHRGVDLARVPGTGAGGRIVRRDLEAHLATVVASDAGAPVATSEFTDVPLTGMRRAIARRLTESKSSVPHFYVTAHVPVDALLDLRARVNAAADRLVSVNDFVLKAVAGALLQVPAANATWNNESVRRFAAVDLAVAIALEDGLVSPVIRGVDRLSLAHVSAAVLDLAERARAGRLQQHELDSGSFAVSNLGSYGVDEFSAILNPPQSGILAVGAAKPRPVVGADGVLGVATVMTVLSADHRVIDGAVAAPWMSAFVAFIENPISMLI